MFMTPLHCKRITNILKLIKKIPLYKLRLNDRRVHTFMTAEAGSGSKRTVIAQVKLLAFGGRPPGEMSRRSCIVEECWEPVEAEWELARPPVLPYDHEVIATATPVAPDLECSRVTCAFRSSGCRRRLPGSRAARRRPHGTSPACWPPTSGSRPLPRAPACWTRRARGPRCRPRPSPARR